MSGASVARAVSFRALLNGTPLNGAKSISVSSENNHNPDRARVLLALDVDPDFQLSWWDTQSSITLDCQISVNGGWTSLGIFNVDDAEWDYLSNCMIVTGRDLSSLLIDARTQETFANQTSSEIASTLAARHGLTPNIKTTSTIVGQYYELEHDRVTADNFSRQTTEWDLLTYLAQQEGFDVSVSGKTLNFQPLPTTTATASLTIQATRQGVMPNANVKSVKAKRSYTLAKDIQVTVKSTNLSSGQAYIRTVKSTGASSSTTVGSTTQNYVFTKPGLTPDGALQLAQQKLRDLTQRERIITIEMPGELSLTKQQTVALTGTNSQFDTTYFIDSISRSVSFKGGFMQTLRLKNSSPVSQTTVL